MWQTKRKKKNTGSEYEYFILQGYPASAEGSSVLVFEAASELLFDSVVELIIAEFVVASAVDAVDTASELPF